MINCLFFTTMLASFVASFNSLETNRNSNSDFVYMRPMLKRETFKNIGKPLPTDQHQVTIAIKQNNLDKLNDELTDRSMPEGSKYQIWMKQDEVIQLTSNKVATDAVLQWCRDNNLQVVWQNKHQEYFQVSTNVSHWESLLRTEFYKYEDHHPHSIAYYKKPISIHSTIKNSLNKNNLFRAESFSIPSHLSPYIHDIFGVVDPPSVMRKYLERHTDKNNVVDTDSISSTSSGSTTSMKDRKKNELHTEAGTFTITKVISVYKIPPMNSSTTSTVSQAVFETQNEGYNPTDLSKFQTQFGLTIQLPTTSSSPYATTTCQKNGNDLCSEGNLDLMYIMGVAPNTQTVFYYIDETSTSVDPFLTYLLALSNSASPPLVNSISWGGVEQQHSASYLLSFQIEAMKLGLQGVTILAASGDDGVADYGARTCTAGQVSTANNCACKADSSSYIDYDGTSISQAGNKWTGTGYFPSFPASCPYITAVGGTQGPESNTTEIAASTTTGAIMTSGGGFSIFYIQKPWQIKQINSYFTGLSSANMPTSGYNILGSGYPDVSLASVNYLIYFSGSSSLVSGTSASCPVFAGMISIINGKRLKRGLSPVGFINPTMYNNSASFHDITSGNNKCSAQGGNCCQSGFYTSKGWDPVTGLGSIVYPKLEKMFLSASYIKSQGIDGLPTQIPSATGGTNPKSSNTTTSGSTIGLIVGCAVAGVVVICLLYVLTSAYIRARRRRAQFSQNKQLLNSNVDKNVKPSEMRMAQLVRTNTPNNSANSFKRPNAPPSSVVTVMRQNSTDAGSENI